MEHIDIQKWNRTTLCSIQNFVSFQKNVHSKVFVRYLCNNVVPVLSNLANVEEGVDSKLDMLKLLAEICENNGFSSEEVKEPLGNVYSRLIVSLVQIRINFNSFNLR